MAILSNTASPSLSFEETREKVRRLLTGDDSSDSKAIFLSRRASLLRQVYERSVDKNGILDRRILEDAIEAAREAVNLTSTRDRFCRPARLSDLSRLLQMLYEHPQTRITGQCIQIGEEAIETAREAAQSTPKGDRSDTRAARFSRLAHLQMEIHLGRAEELLVLDKAIKAAREAVEATPHGHVHEAARLGALAQALENRFKHGHQKSDLQEAIEKGELAVGLDAARRASDLGGYPHQRHRGHAGRLGHLAALCSRLWMLKPDSSDDHLLPILDQAVRHGRQAEDLTPEEDPKKASRMRNLSMLLLRRYDARKSDVDINDAVALAMESLDHTPVDDKEKLSSRHAHLARVLVARSEHWETQSNPKQAEIDRRGAMENAEIALKLSATRRNRCVSLAILAEIHQLLFQRSLVSKHLKLAIDYARLMAHEMPGAAGVQSNCANVLKMGFKRFHAPEHLRDALEYAEKALALSQGSQYSDSDRAARHCDLAGILETRARHVPGAAGDMATALQHAFKAVQLTGPSDPHRARRLGVYCSIVSSSHQQRPTAPVPSSDQIITELEQTISSKAVSGEPDKNYYLGALLTNLARIFEARGQRDKACARYKEVGMSSSFPPMLRVLALRKAGILHADAGEWPRALKMFHGAIAVLSTGGILQSHLLEDHEDTLSQLSGLSSLSATAALKAGKSDHEALVWAERGRGLIAKLAVDAPLHLMHNAGDKIKTSDASFGPPTIGLGRLLSKARTWWQNGRLDSTPEPPVVGGVLADVERTLTEANLCRLAKAGPIVSYVSTKYGSGAFMVTRQGVAFVPLPSLHQHEVEHKARLLNDIKNTTQFRLRDNQTLGKNILPWLWKTAVQPIILHPAFAAYRTEVTEPRLPRVWWVCSGLLGSFPLHAAGVDWKPGSTNCAMGWAVSSYATSVMGLWLARAAREAEWAEKLLAPNKRLLFVAVSQPADRTMAPLDVAAELAELKARSRGQLDVRRLQDPDKSTVQGCLKADEASIIHFACHGTSEPEQPSKSALVLENERLTAGDLMTLDTVAGHRRPRRTELAYLSACSTAKNGCPDLVDEAIHLASALFLFGFPNVVAPLWEVLDTAALDVTGKFYASLTNILDEARRKGNRRDRYSVLLRAFADALHAAIIARLRNGIHRDDYAGWASFVHIGV